MTAIELVLATILIVENVLFLVVGYGRFEETDLR